jgi:hypothetical protein
MSEHGIFIKSGRHELKAIGPLAILTVLVGLALLGMALFLVGRLWGAW